MQCFGEVAETVQIRDESTTRRGRKRIKRDVIHKKNAPEISIEEILDKNCCKKECLSKFSQAHLVSIREHFNCPTYDEQSFYLVGLVTRKDTKKSSGHKRKENPADGKEG